MHYKARGSSGEHYQELRRVDIWQKLIMMNRHGHDNPTRDARTRELI